MRMNKLINFRCNILTLYMVIVDMLLQNKTILDVEILKILIINTSVIWYPFWKYTVASFNKPKARKLPEFIDYHKGSRRVVPIIPN